MANARQLDLFPRADLPRTARHIAECTRPRGSDRAKPFAWVSMGAWARHIGRLLALERASSDHYERFRLTARELTADRIRECRHDDDLARVEQMLVAGNDARRCNVGYIHGLDRVFSKREFGELLVEVRNRRQLLALGRTEPKARRARFDLAAMPDHIIDRLIQSHASMMLVDQLRAERERRSAARMP